MVSYFLPLGGESRKAWGSETQDFWCCHGTLLQAHAMHHEAILFEQDKTLVLGQYIPFETHWNNVHISLKADMTQGLSIGQRFYSEQNQSIQLLNVSIPTHRPEAFIYMLELAGTGEFELRLRVPDWIGAEPELFLNDERILVQVNEGWVTLKRHWNHDQLRWVLPKTLHVIALPDAPEVVAFMDGPLVLAGLVNEERTLIGNIEAPTSLLQVDQEKHHSWWQTGTYRTKSQERNFRFIPLYEVTDETYCVYFPIKRATP
jgi:DUF1680 family protein